MSRCRSAPDQRLVPSEVGAVDAVLLSHDQHADNLDHAGRAFLPRAARVLTTVIGAPRIGGHAVISVSENGEDFNRSFIVSDVYRSLRVPGLYKGGIYGYPHSIIAGNNMHIICSVNKEDIYVFTIPLRQLA